MPASKIPAKQTQPKKAAEFDAVFAGLRSILTPYERTLVAHHDNPDYYYLETKTALYKGRPVFFAAVRKGKGYVSFHLMPVYAYPALRQAISPALRKRMQGKACFNFSVVDDELFEELRLLTAEGAKGFPEKMLIVSAGAQCE
jgi:hypothetical protein